MHKEAWLLLAGLVVVAVANRGMAVEPMGPRGEACRAPSRYDLTARHPVLQAQMAHALRQAGLDKHIRSGRLGVALVDLTHKGQLYYAGVNDDMMLYAASLPKIAILLAVMRSVAQGKIRWSPTLRQRLTNMVTVSSNSDASWATDLVGLKAIAQSVQDPNVCLYDLRHGGLWMGRAYRKHAVARRDPLKNLSHPATARQAARFYLLLDAQVLLSPSMSKRMLQVMGPPGIHHKFVRGIGASPGVTFLARKSGTWGNAHADSALVQHYGKRYILVGLAEIAGGEQVLRQVARLADAIILEGAHRATL